MSSGTNANNYEHRKYRGGAPALGYIILHIKPKMSQCREKYVLSFESLSVTSTQRMPKPSGRAVSEVDILKAVQAETSEMDCLCMLWTEYTFVEL